MLASLLAIAAAPAALAGPSGWAHQAAGFQSNGAVTVKSLSGGSYAGTQNPTGAIAKVNQSAATQAATVIIQATSGGYTEVIPLFVVNSATLPACPTGYTALFSASSTAWGSSVPTITNVGGTRYSLGGFYYPPNGLNYFGWGMDGSPTMNLSNYAMGITLPTGFGQWSPSSAWAARLCSK